MKILLKIILLFVVIFLAIILSCKSEDVVVEWTPKPSKTVKEYSLTFGSESGLTVTVNTGRTNKYTVFSLIEGRTYWFKVTPIGLAGQYGTPSKIIYYTVPKEIIDEFKVRPYVKITPLNKK
jgi:hypothetical protein